MKRTRRTKTSLVLSALALMIHTYREFDSKLGYLFIMLAITPVIDIKFKEKD